MIQASHKNHRVTFLRQRHRLLAEALPALLRLIGHFRFFRSFAPVLFGAVRLPVHTALCLLAGDIVARCILHFHIPAKQLFNAEQR